MEEYSITGSYFVTTIVLNVVASPYLAFFVVCFIF